MNGYPKWFSYKVLSAVLLLVALSGLSLLPHSLLVNFDFNLNFVFLESFRHTFTALHGTLAYLVMFIVGSLSSIHIRFGFRKKQRRTSGIAICFAFAVLAVSALTLYYSGNELAGNTARVSHWAAGSLLVVVFLVHKRSKQTSNT